MASVAPSGPAPPDARDVPLVWLEPDHAPAASPKGNAKATQVTFVNRRAQAVSIEWVGFDGRRKHFADVRPGLTHRQPTYAGHVWVVVEGGQILGVVVANESPGRVEINPPSAAPGVSPPRTDGRETRVMSGWTAHVSTALLGADAAATAAALQLLQAGATRGGHPRRAEARVGRAAKGATLDFTRISGHSAEGRIPS